MHKILKVSTDELETLARALPQSWANDCEIVRTKKRDLRDAIQAYVDALPRRARAGWHEMQPDEALPQVVSPYDFQQARWRAEGKI